RQIQRASEMADPATIARAAEQLGCLGVAFTYNDPIIWAEYVVDTARVCRQAGVKTVAVTSGYITPTARETFYEHIDAANVDLKAFSENFYHKLTGGHLEPVLDTLRWLVHQTDVWVEITNLIIPRANDSPEEIQRMCDFVLDELGPDVPIHFTAFHPDFKLTDRGPTPAETLIRAHETARQTGLHFVYTGNISDRRHQCTYCPHCEKVVIGRDGYTLDTYALRGNRCAHCDGVVAGRFDESPGTWGSRRQAVRIADFADASATSCDSRQGESAMDDTTPSASIPERRGAGRPELSEEDRQRILRAAGRRVAATVTGQVADAMDDAMGRIAMVPLIGAFVSLKRQGQLRSCCGVMAPMMPLVEAVDRAAVRAAGDDPRFPPIAGAELETLDMDVWLLWGMESIAERGEDRVGAVTIGRHGLQISRGSRRGLLLPGVAVDYGFDARKFLQQTCVKAGLPADAWLADDTEVKRFEGLSIRGPLRDYLPVTCDAPPMTVTGVARPSAVAGRFYPGGTEEMNRMLDDMIPEGSRCEPWLAAMVPHAGWLYSGHLAAETLARVEIPRRVIIVAPKHHHGGADWAVTPHHVWSLPGRDVPCDAELAGQLAAGIDGLELDAVAHRHEHSIEVQLPILARLAPHASVVGIAVGGGRIEQFQRFGRQLAGVLWSLPDRPLLIVSSDMNHQADDTETRRRDQLALDAMKTLDPVRLFHTVVENDISMCGVVPAVMVMEALRHLGTLDTCRQVGYTTSAETTGDTRGVVGYAGMLLG
ncbi:MAG: AmmeMemoRadiSam system radical SAM enzyme, partial [Planctomycetes bacterium]|nr:AmmeMemoRadiSam system radical SAM enzyme [Planctomycetota bacterium]